MRHHPQTYLLLLGFGLAMVSGAAAADSPQASLVRPEFCRKAVAGLELPDKLRNPFSWPRATPGFTPPSQEEVAEQFKILNLEAIIWNPGQPRAIINGQLLTAGQEISGVTVMAINKDSVQVGKGRLVYVLEFDKIDILLRPSSDQDR